MDRGQPPLRCPYDQTYAHPGLSESNCLLSIDNG
jgi:hypothetical protein